MGALLDAFLSIEYVAMLEGFFVQAVPEGYREERERAVGRLLRGRIRKQCLYKGNFQDELRLVFKRSEKTIVRSPSGTNFIKPLKKYNV